METLNRLLLCDLAPARRFNGARLNLGKFAQTGSGENLRSGIGHYVRSGLGGSALGGIRMAGTANAAGRIYGGLTGFSAGEASPPEFAALNRGDLTGRPAREVGDRIVDAVCPVDGTQDTEARRDSLSRSNALSAIRSRYGTSPTFSKGAFFRTPWQGLATQNASPRNQADIASFHGSWSLWTFLGHIPV